MALLRVCEEEGYLIDVRLVDQEISLPSMGTFPIDAWISKPVEPADLPNKVARPLRQPAEERLKEAERVTALKPSETG